MCVLLLLLLLFICPSFLHQLSIETGLVSLLLFEVDASDETTAVELNLMLLFISEHIKKLLSSNYLALSK